MCAGRAAHSVRQIIFLTSSKHHSPRPVTHLATTLTLQNALWVAVSTATFHRQRKGALAPEAKPTSLNY
jgi:hypothetical protein